MLVYVFTCTHIRRGKYVTLQFFTSKLECGMLKGIELPPPPPPKEAAAAAPKEEAAATAAVAAAAVAIAGVHLIKITSLLTNQ